MTQNIPPELLSKAGTLQAYVPGGAITDAQNEANALIAMGNPEGAASLVGLSADDMARIRAAARSPADMANAVAGYVNLDTNQKAAVAALAQGNYKDALSKAILIGGQDLGVPPGITSDLMQAGQSMLSGNLWAAIGPLVAAGLAAGGVSAPIIACVGGCIALAEEGLTALGVIKTGPASCDWKVGETCFNGNRPYGPGDPQWKTLSTQWASDFSTQWPFQNIDPMAASVYWEVWWLEHYLTAPDDPMVNSAASLAASIGQSLGLGVLTRPMTKGQWLAMQYQNSPLAQARSLDGFRLAFGRAYLANLEKGINGHPMTDPHQLLNQIAYAHNAQHGGASVTINGDAAPRSAPSVTYLDDGRIANNPAMNMLYQSGLDGTALEGMTTPGGEQVIAAVKANPPTWSGATRETVIERILRGDTDKNRDAPLTIYTGPYLPLHQLGNLTLQRFVGLGSAAPVRAAAPAPPKATGLAALPSWVKIAGGALAGIGAALGLDKIIRR